MSQRTASCKGCGCSCRYCNDQGGLHLHVEIENLKQQLIERENHIVTMETNFLKEADKFPNGEMAAISEELLTWQEKYSRLYEAHKRVQKVNQNLEDKLLRIVDKCETEKNALTSEVANLTRRLVDEKFNVAKLQEENERYRNDVNLAIQLLQCKPSNFVSQKYDSLPSDMQQKVRSYVWSKRRVSDGNGNHHSPRPEVRTIKVPIPTFPPTAMVYSVNRAPAITEKDGVSEEKNSPVDIVSAAIMAKVLEERERERSQARHCETCTCPGKAHPHLQRLSKATMTDPPSPLVNNSSCGTNLTVGRGRLARRAPQQPTEDQAPVVAEAILVNIESAEDSSEGSSGGSGSGGGGGIKAAVPAPPPTAPHDDLMWFESRTSGGRQCSVRLQAGSTNILLDDAAVPVLYRCAPRVHRSTSTSSESSLEPETRNHHHHHHHHQRALVRTETEI